MTNTKNKTISKRTSIIKGVFLLVLIIIPVLGYILYMKHLAIYPETDNAYVETNTVFTTSQISGKVSNIYVTNNQSIKKGDLLFKIDDRPFKYQLDIAKSDFQLSKEQSIAQLQILDSVKAQLKESEARAYVTKQENTRMLVLLKKNAIAQNTVDKTYGELQAANAAVEYSKANIEQQKAMLNVSLAKIQQAESNLKTSELNLKWTKVYASLDGHIDNFTLRSGSLINKGQNLFTEISDHDWWISANYKETQLENIKPGQSAEIVLDMYPGYVFKGIVDSISNGSGSAFSLLPAENATGNWVKVTQRFPVKIKILNSNPKYKLRVGATASVTINTNK